MPRNVVPKIRIRTRTLKSGAKRIILDYTLDGSRKTKTIGPNKPAIRKLARQVAAELQIEIAEGRHRPQSRPVPILFREFVTEYSQIHLPKLKSAKRRRISLQHLARHFGAYRLDQITTRMVEQYQTQRAECVVRGTDQKIRPATVNREVAALKHLFTKAVAWSHIPRSPAQGVKMLPERNQRTRFLSVEEYQDLLAACPLHLKPIVELGWHTGMRIGEILPLKWDQVALKIRLIHLRDSKSGHGRDVPLNDSAVAALQRLPRRLDTPHLFANRDGRHIKRVGRSFKTAAESAGLETVGPNKVTYHCLRHSFLSHLGMCGEAPTTLRDLAGHRTLAMVNRYTHTSATHRAAAVAKLDQLTSEVESQTESREKSG